MENLCRQCGNAVSLGVRFCPNCGARMTSGRRSSLELFLIILATLFFIGWAIVFGVYAACAMVIGFWNGPPPRPYSIYGFLSILTVIICIAEIYLIIKKKYLLIGILFLVGLVTGALIFYHGQ